MTTQSNRSQRGFTLAELAIAIVVISLLMSGGFVSIAAQQDIRNISTTKRSLDDAREALLGYAAAHERLPCPAISTSNGREDPDGSGPCTANPGSSTVGYLPAATLGLSPTDSAGFLIDAWGNRIRYTVTESDTDAFTKPGGIRTSGVSTLDPNLEVCNTATAGDAPCPAGSRLTNQAVAIVYSLGKNGGASTPPTDDEKANTDGGKVFVSASNSSFDDIVLWLSPYTLYNRMITAGAL